MTAVGCSGVAKSFGPVPALRGVDLTVEEGTLAAVLGPSGCGKSTLLRVIAGFERPDAGTVEISGQAVAGPGLHLPPERRRVTIVPQDQALFPHLTVAGNVGYGLPRGSARDDVVGAMLELAGLAGLGRRMPHELSGGQQQRVAVARALAPRPSVVLLDEPFGSLDAGLRAELRADVAALLQRSGSTALLVTHDQEEALSMASSLAVMRDGRIVQHGAPDAVYRHPADLWVANFVGGANVLPGTAGGGGRVECALGVLTPAQAVDPGPVSVVVRPEQIRVTAPGGPDGPGTRAVPGIVESSRYYGHDALVEIALDGGHRVTARLPSDEAVAARGSRVEIRCREPVLVFPREPGG